MLTPSSFDVGAAAERRGGLTAGRDPAATTNKGKRSKESVRADERWRARHQVTLPGFGLPVGATTKAMEFYADKTGDRLISADGAVVYDLAADTTAVSPYAALTSKRRFKSLPAAPLLTTGCVVTPSPYNSAVAFSMASCRPWPTA